MSTPALNPLVDKIRTAHPGAYDDMDDATLTKKVLAKYPQYSDLAVSPQSTMPGAPSTIFAPSGAPAGKLKMEPVKQGILGRLESGPEDVPPMPSKVPESIKNAGPGLGDWIGGMTLGGAATLGAGAVAPAVRPVAQLVARHPLVSMAAIEAAKQLPGAAGRIAGRVPSWLPLLAGGKEAAPEAAEGEAAATDQIPGRPYMPNPRFEPTTPAEPIPPRSGLLLKGEVAPPIVPRAIAPKEVETKLGEALGNKPITIKPGVPIRNQFQAPALTAPKGQTAVESTALKSFKYDPAARELHITAKDGIAHVYGEVTPDQAKAFANAGSKGQAWKAIRDNNVHIAKVSQEGVRTADKGASRFRLATPESQPSGDLVPALRKSLAAARKAKGD